MKYKPVGDRFCQNEKCKDHIKFGKGSIIIILNMKRDKGDGDAISARPVKDFLFNKGNSIL